MKDKAPARMRIPRGSRPAPVGTGCGKKSDLPGPGAHRHVGGIAEAGCQGAPLVPPMNRGRAPCLCPVARAGPGRCVRHRPVAQGTDTAGLTPHLSGTGRRLPGRSFMAHGPAGDSGRRNRPPMANDAGRTLFHSANRAFLRAINFASADLIATAPGAGRPGAG